jgi:hypothetical protein
VSSPLEGKEERTERNGRMVTHVVIMQEFVTLFSLLWCMFEDYHDKKLTGVRYHSYHPSTWEEEEHEFQANLGYIARPSLKNQ